jgi:hypothetical protein
MEDVQIEFDRSAPGVGKAMVKDQAGAPIADLTVAAHAFAPVNHLYQSFMSDDSGKYLASIIMEGEQSEHEDEKGSIVLHDHDFNKALSIEDVYEIPFRELWMRSGRQTFDPLKTL